MKTLLIIVALSLVALGCIGIPLSESVHSSLKLGERIDESGNVISHIEKRKIAKPKYYIMSAEGPGRHRTIHTQYILHRRSKTIDLNFLKCKVPRESLAYSEYIDHFLPVYMTDNWIAFRILGITRSKYDLEMVVFNESDVIHKEVVFGCSRSRPGCESELNDYGVFPLTGNEIISFQTINGLTEYDVVGLKWKR